MILNVIHVILCNSTSNNGSQDPWKPNHQLLHAACPGLLESRGRPLPCGSSELQTHGHVSPGEDRAVGRAGLGRLARLLEAQGAFRSSLTCQSICPSTAAVASELGVGRPPWSFSTNRLCLKNILLDSDCVHIFTIINIMCVQEKNIMGC